MQKGPSELHLFIQCVYTLYASPSHYTYGSETSRILVQPPRHKYTIVTVTIAYGPTPL